MVRSKPYVILSAAVSIDGKIATRSGMSNFSSKRDLIRVHRLRSQVDAIFVGRNTVSVDDPSLTVRYVRGKNPIRVILDPNAKISPSSTIVNTARKIPTIVVVSHKAPTKSVYKLEKKGVEVISVGSNHIDLQKLLCVMIKRGVKKILLEGGGLTNWYFLKQNLIDEIIVTITPYIIGGRNAVSLIEGNGLDKISKFYSFKLKSVKRIENEIVLRYVR